MTRTTLVTIAIIGSLSSRLPAQTDSVAWQSCSAMVRAVQSGLPVSTQVRAVTRLQQCPQDAGQVLPSLWRNPTVSDSVFAAVYATSIVVDDRPIFLAVLDAAEDPALSLPQRLGALAVLARYVDPSTGITADALMNPPAMWRPTGTVDGRRVSGPEPVSAAEANQALVVFKRLSSTGSPDEIKRAAHYLRAGFALLRPDVTPLSPNAITGTWDCRGALKLQSTADIVLGVSLVDSSGRPFMRIPIFPPGQAIPAGYPTHQKPGEFFATLAMRGPISVRYGSGTLLSLGCSSSR